jgi:hypothetical protein
MVKAEAAQSRCMHFCFHATPHTRARALAEAIYSNRVNTGALTNALAQAEFVYGEFGATSVGLALHAELPDEKMGVMVAANSGRPGGAVGLLGGGGVDRAQVKTGHRTQEEDVLSAWLVAECGEGNTAGWHDLFSSTTNRAWGVLDSNSQDASTLQAVNYRTTTEPADFGDAWAVANGQLCGKAWDGSGVADQRRAAKVWTPQNSLRPPHHQPDAE